MKLLTSVVLTPYDMALMQKKFEERITSGRLFDLQGAIPSPWFGDIVRKLAQACVLRVLKNQATMLRENASVADATMRWIEMTPQQRFETLPHWLQFWYRSHPDQTPAHFRSFQN